MKINPNVHNCTPAPIAEAWSWVKTPDADSLLNLCQAVPAHLPPQSLLDHIGTAIAAGKGAMYTDIAGIQPLRDALADNIQTRYGGDVRGEDVMVTAGCNQAFCAVIDSLCRRGDNVIMPLPYYFNHAMWLSIRGIDVQSLPFDADNTDPDYTLAEQRIDDDTRAIVLVSPNNPTGAVYTSECLKQFQQLAEAKGIALIIDETYRDFVDEQQTLHTLFSQQNWRDSFIHLYSFSKVYSLTGHRVGAIVAGEKLRAQLEKIQDCVAISAPHVGQLAALYGLLHLDGWKREKANELMAKAEAIRRAFQHPDLSYKLISVGAYFAYVQHPFKEDAWAVAKRLAQQFELVCLPGSYFGEGQQRYLRFAFANLEVDVFPRIVERLLLSQS